VTKELDALLTELYVVIDDHVVRPHRGRGRRPVLSDSELITLAVAQILQGFHCERRWVRHIRANPQWRGLFPYLPDQSGHHKRLKGARTLLCQAINVLAEHCPSRFDDLWMTDATPVPCGTSRERGQTIRSGRTRRLRILRLALALLLGSQALPGLHRRRDADHVVPGRPEDRGTRGRRRAATTQPSPRR